MSIELTPEELKLASDTARRFAWKWPGVETEDLQAHLWTWLCEHYKTVLRYREHQMGMPMLAAALKHESWAYCRKEQAAVQHINLGEATDYDRGLVERALPYIWEYTDWHQATEVQEQYDIALTILADVSAAYYSLSDSDRDVLAWRHRDHLSLRNIANILNTTEEGARKRYSRTLTRLLERLSGNSARWDGIHNPSPRP